MAIKTVLVADDDKNLIYLVTVALERSGYKVLSVGDGKQAVIQAGKKKPSLIILDINMPVMNGWDALAMLKSGPATKAIPVLMLTTEGLVADVDRAMNSGANGYIVKPFDMKHLLDKITALAV